MRCDAGDTAHKALTAKGVRSPDQGYRRKFIGCSAIEVEMGNRCSYCTIPTSDGTPS